MRQSMAVLGLAVVTMGEPLARDMLQRMTDHLLQYGDVAVRKAVPLALGLAFLSNPEYTIVDTLSRLSHDPDVATAENAILALGFIGAGTNNSRIAGLLRQLTVFYKSEPEMVFVVRLAQGLLHMGKGLLTLSPVHSDRLLLSHVGMGGVLATMMCGLELTATVLDKYHYLLFTLCTAMEPCMVMAVTEDLSPVSADVRVGEALEIVGQAGKPKTISGFQTHTTPVLVGVGDRAELAASDWDAVTPVLEGVVVLTKKAKGSGEEEDA
jgi:26S proteasome regulatory subunit N1